MKTYAEAKDARDQLDQLRRRACANLAAIPGVGSGPMGLTPDAVKFSPAYRAAKAEMDRLFTALRTARSGAALNPQKGTAMNVHTTPPPAATLQTVEVGAILYTSWGYEQTNYDFYQLVERRGKSTLVLRKLQVTKESEGWARDKVMPVKDQFDGEEKLTRRIDKHGYAKVTDYAHLYVWDGAAKHATSYA